MARLELNNEDYLNLLLIHGECDRVVTRTCALFAIRYPDRPRPTRDTVKRILSNLTQFGCFKAKVKKVKPVVNNIDNEINVLGYYAAYPEASLRCGARDLGVPMTSIQRILKKHKFHPYSFSLVQSLKETDYNKRIEFAEFMLIKCQEDNEYLKNIIWCDESKFTKNGMFNRHNSHYWSEENQHLTRVRGFQERWNFNVFCAIRDNQVVALHFYDGNLNG